MSSTGLWNRNFTVMIIGQIMSLFGNAILRFSLSLYVLDTTGSAAVFGGILALSMVPTVLLSPIGGVIADRFPRQRIMYLLDFATAGLIVFCSILFLKHVSIAAIAVMMMVLSVIQACYQPSVQAAIPALSSDKNLMAANGVAVQVQALAMLTGPIFGGLLYGYMGIFPILAASGICFFSSAVMELFLRIPFAPPPATAAPLRQIGRDLSDAFRFLRHDKPQLMQLLLIIAGLNLFLASLFNVGLPFLVKTHLGLSPQLYGFAEASLGLGSIVGGLCSGFLSQRLPFARSHLFIAATAALVLPMGLILFLGAPASISYWVIVLCMLLGIVCSTIFSIAAQTFLQRQTPADMLGKIASFVSSIAVCAMPLGQLMYGVFFELCGQAPWVPVVFGGVTGLLLSWCTGRALGRTGDTAA